MKSIRKKIRKVINEMYINRKVTGVSPGETLGSMLSKSMEKENEEYRTSIEKNTEQKRQEAFNKLKKIHSQARLDEKASKALLKYFTHGSRNFYVGMDCSIIYLRSEDGENEKYHKDIFCHIVWHDDFSKHSTLYYTRESRKTAPDFGYEIGESLREWMKNTK